MSAFKDEPLACETLSGGGVSWSSDKRSDDDVRCPDRGSLRESLCPATADRNFRAGDDVRASNPESQSVLGFVLRSLARGDVRFCALFPSREIRPVTRCANLTGDVDVERERGLSTLERGLTTEFSGDAELDGGRTRFSGDVDLDGSTCIAGDNELELSSVPPFGPFTSGGLTGPRDA